jgi:hypothetical protein
MQPAREFFKGKGAGQASSAPSMPALASSRVDVEKVEDSAAFRAALAGADKGYIVCKAPNGDFHSVHTGSSACDLPELKKLLAKATGVPVAQQVLYQHGQLLDDTHAPMTIFIRASAADLITVFRQNAGGRTLKVRDRCRVEDFDFPVPPLPFPTDALSDWCIRMILTLCITQMKLELPDFSQHEFDFPFDAKPTEVCWSAVQHQLSAVFHIPLDLMV